MSADADGKRGVAEDVVLSVAEAIRFGERALERLGFSAEEASIIAANLVDAELCGYPALGLARVLTIAEHARMKQPRKAVSVVHETAVSATIDGGNTVGFYAVYRGAQIAIAKARTSRFAVVGVHNSYLSGRNAYYLEMIARARAMWACISPAARRSSRRSEADSPRSAPIRSRSVCRLTLSRIFSIWELRRLITAT